VHHGRLPIRPKRRMLSISAVSVFDNPGRVLLRCIYENVL
jgi:hypothetical protein